MSPRKPDPQTRPLLIEIAARLLAEQGPTALTTRRVTAAAGTSTMAVYTHFGGMSDLVREMVHEGFARLHEQLSVVEPSDDPVADLALIGRAYRHTALTDPHLYAAMFGGMSLSGFSLTEQDRQHGRYNLTSVVDCAGRCVAAGRFRADDAGLIAHQMWIAVHGLVNLEIGAYLIEPWPADRCFEAQLVNLMVGAGDTVADATRSVTTSADRFAELPTRPAAHTGRTAGDC